MYRSEFSKKAAPEMDPLRLGMGWQVNELDKAKVLAESTYGDSHTGSAHLLELVEIACNGVKEARTHLLTLEQNGEYNRTLS